MLGSPDAHSQESELCCIYYIKFTISSTFESRPLPRRLLRLAIDCACCARRVSTLTRIPPPRSNSDVSSAWPPIWVPSWYEIPGEEGRVSWVAPASGAWRWRRRRAQGAGPTAQNTSAQRAQPYPSRRRFCQRRPAGHLAAVARRGCRSSPHSPPVGVGSLVSSCKRTRGAPVAHERARTPDAQTPGALTNRQVLVISCWSTLSATTGSAMPHQGATCSPAIAGADIGA